MIRGIPQDETRARVARFTATFPPEMSGAVLSDDQYIYYLCAFHFIPTERPIMLVVTREGERILFVPRLEEEHAKHASHADRVVSYPEYPGEVHPLTLFVELLKELGLDKGTLGLTTTATRTCWATRGRCCRNWSPTPCGACIPNLTA